MSLSAQIDLAADAEIIVGPYGAGMNLGLFAPRNIPIVEIGYPELRLRILPAICAALSQKYVSADRPSFPEGRNSLRLDFSVPPEKILARVTAALGRT